MSEAIKQQPEPAENKSADSLRNESPALDVINSLHGSGEKEIEINKESKGNFSSANNVEQKNKKKSKAPIILALAGTCLVAVSVLGAKVGTDSFNSQFSQIQGTMQNQALSLESLSADVEKMKLNSLASEQNSEKIQLLGIQIAAVDERVNAAQQERKEILDKTDILLSRIDTIDKEIERLGFADARITKQINNRTVPVKRQAKVQPTPPKTVKNENFELLSIDYWGNELQAVVKTSDGQTLFLSQGDLYDGWRVLKIDRASSEVWLDKNNKQQKLVAAL